MDTSQEAANPIVSTSKASFLSRFFAFFKGKPTLVWKWALAHKIAASLIALAVLGTGYWIVKSATAPKVEYVTEKAVRMNLKQTVSATGKVDSDSSVDLKFAATGEVEKVNFNTGDSVMKDQVIVSLKHDALANQIKEAQAALDLQKANYLKVATGAKKEEVVVALRKVESAQVAYDSAVKDLANLKVKLATDLDSLRTTVKNLTQALEDTKTTADLNVANTKANLLSSLNSAITKSTYSVTQADYVLADTDLKKIYSAQDYYTAQQSRSELNDIGQFLTAAKNDVNAATASYSDADLTTAVNSTDILISKVEELLRLIMSGLNSTTPDQTVTDARLTAFKTIIKAEQDSNSAVKFDVQSKDQAWVSAIANRPISINAAQSSLDTAQSNLATAIATNDIQLTQAQTQIDSALTQLNLAKAELALTQSKATSSDLAIAQAQIDQAQSALDRLNTALKDYEIIAPFDGVIGKITVKESQSVTPADVIVTMIGEEKFKIVVDIPESDIAKVAVGNPAILTLDAYSDDIKFTGKVTSIDTAETLIADVVYYKVEIALDHTDQVVKQGMSANIDIQTNERDNALVVSARAVLDNPDGTKYVRVLVGGQPLQATVTTGLRGDDGKIEILSGLMEGDLVITFEKKL